ncbi:VOC family protein [Christiangramia crocea]|uniref:VOC family protein n=1 Tax=Christiangramia crocea TaxID=2904124 RepID=A0A9X1V0C0_9FLAO|nr:VOC family protein [Gramella crocea]MCG9972799.1 VOC family protein [Gramella crocea]
MKVRTIGIPVLDQEQALKFYTQKLGFVKSKDIPVGENHRWLTVVSKEEPDGPEVLLEPSPNNFAPAKDYQNALFRAGIPYTQFNVDDIEADFKRLSEQGVSFSMKPTDVGSALIAILDDTCGNHIQLVEMKK